MIGTQNEGSLHASLKGYYRQPEDVVEGQVKGYVIDLVQCERLVEIQTKNFSAMKKKLHDLLAEYPMHVVYPIAVKRYLVQVAPETGEILSTRKSPKSGTIWDLFSELIRIPHLILHPHLTIEAVFTVEQEIRCPDGRGSWRRRGVSIVDRRLIEVVSRQAFSGSTDYLSLLPEHLSFPFTNKELAKAVQINVSTARKLTYTYKKAGLLKEVGKRGNEIVYSRECMDKLSTIYTGYPQDTA